MEIRHAEKNQWREAAGLALLLWPSHQKEELEREFQALLQDPQAAVFLAWQGEEAVGFAQCSLRQDYVEGSASSPVGYLEGIYVRPDYRHRGLARALLSRCEDWSREKGCREMGYDCSLENLDSQRFHLRSGFDEAGQIRCILKVLEG